MMVKTDGRTRILSRGKRALIGLILVVVGLVVAFVGLNRAFVTEVGRPWDVSYGGPVGGPISGTIAHEDGHVETFTVQNEAELRVFLERRELELTEEYGLRTTALMGKVLLFGGLAFAALGTVVVFSSRLGAAGDRLFKRA
jgi:hypothetical protein